MEANEVMDWIMYNLSGFGNFANSSNIRRISLKFGKNMIHILSHFQIFWNVPGIFLILSSILVSTKITNIGFGGSGHVQKSKKHGILSKSGFYCTNLKQINSRKLSKVLFKHLFTINGSTNAIFIPIIILWFSYDFSYDFPMIILWLATHGYP